MHWPVISCKLSMTTIPDPEWLVCCVLCMIDSSQQAKRTNNGWVLKSSLYLNLLRSMRRVHCWLTESFIDISCKVFDTLHQQHFLKESKHKKPKFISYCSGVRSGKNVTGSRGMSWTSVCVGHTVIYIYEQLIAHSTFIQYKLNETWWH